MRSVPTKMRLNGGLTGMLGRGIYISRSDITIKYKQDQGSDAHDKESAWPGLQVILKPCQSVEIDYRKSEQRSRSVSAVHTYYG